MRSTAATSGSASTASRAGRLAWMSARTATRMTRSCLTTLDGMADLTVGYAAMLEQFHPPEPSSYRAAPSSTASPAAWPPTTSSRGCRSRARRRSCGTCWPRRRAHQGRPRPRRHLPVVPVPPGDGRAGGGDARGDVPRPALARARLRRGAQRARRRRLLARGGRADRCGCSRRSRSSRSCSRLSRQGRQARGPVLQAGDDPAVDACPRRRRRSTSPPPGRSPPSAPASSPTASSPSARRWRRSRAVRQVRRGRPRGRQGPRHDAEASCSCTCPGPRPTRRRWPTR